MSSWKCFCFFLIQTNLIFCQRIITLLFTLHYFCRCFAPIKMHVSSAYCLYDLLILTGSFRTSVWISLSPAISSNLFCKSSTNERKLLVQVYLPVALPVLFCSLPIILWNLCCQMLLLGILTEDITQKIQSHISYTIFLHFHEIRWRKIWSNQYPPILLYMMSLEY